MKKKDNHIAEPSKLTVFRSIQEMKDAPFSFPTTKPLAHLQAERKAVFDQLRSSVSPGKGRRSRKLKRK